jgi:hypothetical protein
LSGPYNREDIKNLRLISERICDISSAFLITFTKTNFTSESFAHLERLAAHPIFSKNIIKVTINVSYYDKYLAESLPNFATRCAEELSQQIHWMRETAHAAATIEESDRITRQAQALIVLPQPWARTSLPTFDPSKAIAEQMIVWDAHQEYVVRYNNQEALMENGEHIRRLMCAFSQSTALDAISFRDTSRESEIKDLDEKACSSVIAWKAEGLKNRYLKPSNWTGSFNPRLTYRTAYAGIFLRRSLPTRFASSRSGLY